MSGGRSSSGNLSDTWEYDGTDWTQRSAMPTYRYYHSLAYSPAAGGIVVLGGYGSTQSYLYDGSSLASLSMPLPRTIRAAGYFDSARDRLVALTLYGNVFEAPLAGPWVSRIAERPEGTYSPKVTYDPDLHAAVLIPGSDISSPAGTFKWDGTAWTTVTGSRPSPVAAVYADFLSSTVTVSSNGDTWKFDGVTWSNLAPATRPLPAGGNGYLYDFALACDSARQRVVLFGGNTQDSNYNIVDSAETWEFDGVNWQKASPVSSPPARSSHAMAWDASRNVTVMYGGLKYVYDAANGYYYYELLDDTWEYDGSTWTQKTYTPGTEPIYSYYHQMTWVGSLGGVVAWGGYGVSYFASLWNGTVWQQLPFVNLPQGYLRFGLAWDSERDVLVATNGANTFEYFRPALPVLTAPASAVSGVSYSVTWTPGGGGPASFEVQESNEPTFAAPVTTTSSDTSMLFAHTTAGTETYYYRVRAVSCTAGTLHTGWSNVGSVVVSTCTPPDTPVITAPASLWPEQSFKASVPAVAGVTYAWTVTNGTVTAGDGTREITVTAWATGPVTIKVTETSVATGCASEQGSVSIPVALAATRFYAVTPCRLFDTRNSLPAADEATPILGPGETRTLTVGTRCGLSSSTVRTLSVNQTVASQTADGELVLYRGDLASEPVTSNISYRVGKTRANNGMLELSRNGDGTFKVHNRSTSSVHFILDVNGTFQ
jgi:hypothetical protein